MSNFLIAADRFDNALGVMVTNVHAWNAGFVSVYFQRIVQTFNECMKALNVLKISTVSYSF